MKVTFEEQCSYLKSKVVKVANSIRDEVSLAQESLGLTDTTLEEEFKANTDTFKKFVRIAMYQLQKGVPNSTYHAGVVMYLCEKYGVQYDVMAGVYFTEDYSKTKAAKRDRAALKDGKLIYPNHVCIKAGGNKYLLDESMEMVKEVKVS